MKTRSATLLSAALMTCVSLNSCSKKNDSPGGGNGTYISKLSFVVDGDMFKKQTVTVIGKKGAGNNYCYYSGKDSVTTISIDDGPDSNTTGKNGVIIFFNGKTPGTDKAGDSPNGGTYYAIVFNIHVVDMNGTMHTFFFEDSQEDPGTITVTKFGAEGGIVEGNFSGVLQDDNAEPNIHITNGTFSITRNQDID